MMKTALRIILAVLLLPLCYLAVQSPAPMPPSVFCLACLRPAKTLAFRPVRVKRINHAQERPLSLYRGESGHYVPPDDLRIFADGTTLLFTRDQCVTCHLRDDGLTATSLPSLVEQAGPVSAGWNARTFLGQYIAGDEAGGQARCLVVRYGVHGSRLSCDGILSPERILPSVAYRHLYPGSWGMDYSLDAQGNSYIAYQEQDTGVWRQVMVDALGRFVRYVPSAQRDGGGYYYQRTADAETSAELLTIYTPTGQVCARITFPYAIPEGNITWGTTNARWHPVADGIWIELLGCDPQDHRTTRFMHLTHDGKPSAWFDIPATGLFAHYDRALCTPVFTSDGHLYFGGIALIGEEQDVAYDLFRTDLGE